MSNEENKPAAGNEGGKQFAQWFARNYPKDTLLYDPYWHAPKIYSAAIKAHSRDAEKGEIAQHVADVQEAVDWTIANARTHGPLGLLNSPTAEKADALSNEAIYKLIEEHFNYGTVYTEDAAQHYATAGEIAEFACAVLALRPAAADAVAQDKTSTDARASAVCAVMPNGVTVTNVYEAYAAGLEAAAKECDHWQQIGAPTHKCGEQMAYVIRGIKADRPAAVMAAVQADNRRCKKCASIRGGDTCWKCGSETFTPDPRCGEEPRLPPIDRIRELAKEVGYAIGVHGSQQRDFDVIAAPWTDAAIGNHALLQHIAAGLTTDNGPAHIISTERKPLGRYAATIQMDGWYKQLDISVCPNEQYTQPDRTAAMGAAGQAVIVSNDRFGPILEIPGFTYTIHREITPDQIERISSNAANVVMHRVSQALHAHLNRPAASGAMGAGDLWEIDLATAILSLRVKNPHEEDNCGLWSMGFRYAQTTIATMVANRAPASGAAVLSDDQRDAARWRAFVSSDRIKMQGSAGLDDPMPNNYAHMALEIWTTYDRAGYSPELLAKMDKGNALGREWLTKYADVAVAAMQARAATGEKGGAA